MLKKCTLVVFLLFLVESSHAQTSQVVSRWEKGKTPQGEMIRSLLQGDPLHSQLPAYINTRFRLPRNLPIVYREAGKVNAWYSPGEHKITVSYDLGAFLLNYFKARGVANPQQRTRETIAFILLHELSHALIHELDLPVVGREEDAADELATLLALEALGDRGVQLALTSANWFNLMGVSKVDLKKLHFWDEHSLDRQRFFKILCLLYGSNPRGVESVVKPLVPYTRLRTASERHPKKVARWARLLAAHRVPPGKPRLHTVYPDPARPRTLSFQTDAPKGTLLPVGELLRVQSFQSMVTELNRRFTLPKNLFVMYRSTDVDKNFFLPMTGNLIMSRQFFDSARVKLARRLPANQLEETMRSLEQFSLLQEFARALIYDCDLPITVEPEAAAAELTTMMLVSNPKLRPLALPMSRWYETLAGENINVLQLKYWSESALDKQQFYDLLGYLYCADPVTYAHLGLKFDKRRRQKLAWEYRIKKRNWQRLLQPFGSPF